jgi:nitronate monooxygenase
METRFTQLLGCPVPIQQAPMGAVSSPDLAVAVADAGGVGTVAALGLPLEVLVQRLDDVRLRTSGVLSANFAGEDVDEQAVVAAAERVRLVDFFWSDPSPRRVDLAHGAGALAGWQVGSVDEARAAEDAGCDVVTVQGVEAGGHVRGRLGLLPLLDAVLGAVEVPVVAAGGLATARAVAAVLAAGADAARVGTRFVATHEALEEGAHRDYVDALLAAGGDDTVVTDAYSMMWPAAPHRVLASCIAAAARSEREPVGQTTLGGVTFPVTRWSVVSPNARSTGDIAAMALYAGQGVGAIDRIASAAEVVAELSGQFVQV